VGFLHQEHHLELIILVNMPIQADVQGTHLLHTPLLLQLELHFILMTSLPATTVCHVNQAKVIVDTTAILVMTIHRTTITDTTLLQAMVLPQTVFSREVHILGKSLIFIPMEWTAALTTESTKEMQANQ
jgi:hypothetical protein